MNQQTAIAHRPSKAAAKPLSECKTLDEALRTDEIKGRIAAALPRHMSPDRMLRVMALATYRTPELRRMNMMEVLGAMVGLSSLGLEPNTPLGHAYLIPYKDRLQVILGYRGMLELARRSGAIKSIHADVVYPGDEFSFEYGSHQHLRHVPKGERTGQPQWAYAHAMLSDGEAFEVLPWSEVMHIRHQSGARKGPWETHAEAMARKTAIRRLWKYLPQSIEMMNAEMFDEAAERAGSGYGQILEATPSDLQEIGPGAMIGGESADDEPVSQGEEPEAPADLTVEPEPVDEAAEVAADDMIQFQPLRGRPTACSPDEFADHIRKVIAKAPESARAIWDVNGEGLDKLAALAPEAFEDLQALMGAADA